MTDLRDDSDDEIFIDNPRFSRPLLPKPVPKVQWTVCGKVRSFSSLSLLEWSYIVLCSIALVICFGLTVYRLVSHPLDTKDFTFAVLLLLTVVFSFYYVYHSVFTERSDELLVFVLSDTIVLIYCIINYITTRKTLIKLVRLVIVCTLSPVLIGISIFLSCRYLRSTKFFCESIGHFQDMYKAWQVFFFCGSLLEFDLQLQLSMLVLVMGDSGKNMDAVQATIIACGIILTLVFIALGIIGLRRENKKIMVAFYALGLFEPAFVGYRFYYAARFEEDEPEIYDSTFVCGSFSLTIWLSLMVLTAYYIQNVFGTGFKEKFQSKQCSQENVRRYRSLQFKDIDSPDAPLLDISGPMDSGHNYGRSMHSFVE